MFRPMHLGLVLLLIPSVALSKPKAKRARWQCPTKGRATIKRIADAEARKAYLGPASHMYSDCQTDDDIETGKCKPRALFRVTPGYESKSGDLAQVKRVDLNRDGAKDLRVNLYNCVNHGECVRGLYAACGGDQYYPVMGPKYANSIKFSKRRDRDGGFRWRRITWVHSDGSDGRPHRTRHRFLAGKYHLLADWKRLRRAAKSQKK